MGFQVPNSVTLNAAVAVMFHYYTRCGSLLKPTVSDLLKLDPQCGQQKCAPGNLVFGNIWFIADGVHYLYSG